MSENALSSEIISIQCPSEEAGITTARFMLNHCTERSVPFLARTLTIGKEGARMSTKQCLACL